MYIVVVSVLNNLTCSMLLLLYVELHTHICFSLSVAHTPVAGIFDSKLHSKLKTINIFSASKQKWFS